MKWYIFYGESNTWLDEEDQWSSSFLDAQEFESEDEAYSKAERLGKALDTTEIYVLAYNYCR